MMTEKEFHGAMTNQSPQWNYMMDYLTGILTPKSAVTDQEHLDAACLYATTFFHGPNVFHGKREKHSSTR